MNQLKKLVSDFLKSTNDYADITHDYFRAINRSIKQGDIEEGNDAGYTYELGNILEVMDQQRRRFPGARLLCSAGWRYHLRERHSHFKKLFT